MKQKIVLFFAAVILGSSAFCASPKAVFAEEMNTEAATEGMVATSEEMAGVEKVGSDDMVPVTGSEVKDGTYEINVESSSSMFRIVKAELTVQSGSMSAVLTLSGTGYLQLFMGTGEEAVAADASAYIGYVEDADGAYTYTVPVEALNQEIDCAAFSKRKEKWYDRTLVFDAASLPADALLVDLTPADEAATESEPEESVTESTEQDLGTAEPAETVLSDGTYQVDVVLSGGSGKASVTSPAKVTVKDHTAAATIEWSSPHYDYMIVGNTTYEPVNKDGNSTFEIPVTAWNEEMTVIADTTAMSEPHEITYTLTFDEDSAKKDGVSIQYIVGIFAVCFLAGTGIGYMIWKRKKK